MNKNLLQTFIVLLIFGSFYHFSLWRNSSTGFLSSGGERYNTNPLVEKRSSSEASQVVFDIALSNPRAGSGRIDSKYKFADGTVALYDEVRYLLVIRDVSTRNEIEFSTDDAVIFVLESMDDEESYEPYTARQVDANSLIDLASSQYVSVAYIDSEIERTPISAKSVEIYPGDAH